MNPISNKQRASLVGVLILAAYSMLTYPITKNIPLGVISDIVSGLAVIGNIQRYPYLFFYFWSAVFLYLILSHTNNSKIYF